MNRPMQASLCLLLLGMLAAPGGTQAAETPRQQARQMDANVDGTLSADEHEAGVEMTFDSVDTDEDSFISADELDTPGTPAARAAPGPPLTYRGADIDRRCCPRPSMPWARKRYSGSRRQPRRQPQSGRDQGSDEAPALPSSRPDRWPLPAQVTRFTINP